MRANHATPCNLTGGQEADILQGEALMRGHDADAVIANRSYDGDDFVAAIEASGAAVVIPPKKNRIFKRGDDKPLYKERNLAERFINRIKHHRRVATRYEKTDRNFLGFVQVAAIMMILSDVFERFSQDSLLSVMAQGVTENALNPPVVDQLFEDVAQKQFTHELLFSTIVDQMSVVVCRIRPSIHAAFQARAETVGATIDAVYDKLDGTETAVSTTMAHSVADRLTPVVDAMGGGRQQWLPGDRVRILDGNHPSGTERRGTDLRLADPAPTPGPGLRAADREQQGDDPAGGDLYDAPKTQTLVGTPLSHVLSSTLYVFRPWMRMEARP